MVLWAPVLYKPLRGPQKAVAAVKPGALSLIVVPSLDAKLDFPDAVDVPETINQEVMNLGFEVSR